MTEAKAITIVVLVLQTIESFSMNAMLHDSITLFDLATHLYT